MKYMIYSFIFSSFLISCQIPGVLYYHDYAVIPLGIFAYRAEFIIGQGQALFAVVYILSCI